MEQTQENITVLLVDGHTIVRQGLRALLEGEHDIRVVGEADNGRKAVHLAEKLIPNIVIIDITTPLLGGLEAGRMIRKQHAGTKMIFLSMSADEEFVAQVLEFGEAGCLVKQTAANDLIRAIREVHRGNVFFSPSISRLIASKFREKGQAEPVILRKPKILSDREAQILRLIADGMTNKEIGQKLDISTKTVEKHRQRIMDKLGIHDVAGLTRYAIAKGIV